MTRLAEIAPQLEARPRAGWGGQTGPALLAIGLFCALSISAGLASKGFLEADGCTHYLYARFALDEPHFLLNVWGRPLFTATYAIPAAMGGFFGARLMSLAYAVGCGIVAMAIARGQNYRWPVLALIFTLAQPLVFLHSFSELTELSFATLIGLAFLAYQRRKWLLMALLVGLGPLGRPEGFGFLALGAVTLLAHRRWSWILVLPLPVFAWNLGGWLISGREGPLWGWLAANWPYSEQSLYQAGHALHYVALLPAVTSPFIFPATCMGLWVSLSGARLAPDRHRRICQILIAAIPLLILLGHSLLYATGKLASSGEIRYMLVVAPFWALLAAKGWDAAFLAMNWRYALRWAGAAALAAGFANAVYPVVPLRSTPDFDRSKQFVDWYRTNGLESRYPRVCTAQMTIYFMLDVSPTDGERALEFQREKVSPAPQGTILVWDPTYSLYNADERRSIRIEELLKSGWKAAPPDFPDFDGGWRILLSDELRNDAAGAPQPPR